MWRGNKKILFQVFSIQKITDMLSSNRNLSLYTKLITVLKDVRRWHFLTTEAAETLRVACLPPGEHIFRKKYLGNRSFKKSHFVMGLTIKFVFLRIF